MRLTNKIYIGSGLFMLLVLVLIVTVFNIAAGLNQKQSLYNENRNKNSDLINGLRNEIADIDRLLHESVQLQSVELQLFEAISIHRSQAITAMESTKLLSQEESLQRWLVQIHVRMDDFAESLERMMDAILQGRTNSALSEWQLVHIKREALDADIDGYLMQLDIELKNQLQATEKAYRNMRVLLLGSFVFLMLIVGFMIAINVRKVSRRLASSVAVMNKMALGSVNSIERMSVDSNDEVAAVALAYNRLADTLERHIRYEQSYQKEIEEQNWLKTTIAEITSLYQGVQDVGNLARRLLSKLSPLLGAAYASFYLVDDYEGRRTLTPMYAYGGNNEFTVMDSFSFGEGLVGQCAVERQTIFLENLSESDIHIRSSFLDAIPNQIVIVPIEYADRVLAVLEFATLTQFTQLQQILLQQIINNAGVPLLRVLDNMRVKQLLSDSQTLTEELQTQSEELQQQQEELMSINEKLEEQYRNEELRSLELQNIKAELEDKAQLLEQSSRYKSQFLANMSHELRTPLNSLLILAKILQDNEGGRLSEKQAEYAAAIHSSGQQLLLLINDILDLSKVESGKVELNTEVVSIAELIRFSENMFIPISQQRKIEFHVHIENDVPMMINTDPHRLMQIVNNLLANAFKFTEQGYVSLKVEGHRGNLSDDAYDGLAISVTDTGIGIPEEKHMIIFEAFLQADGTTSRKYGGSGLGLSISRNIAELLGGSIKVQSMEGHGSTFTLYIPLDVSSTTNQQADNAASEAAAGAELPKPADLREELAMQGHTILIVDDDIRNVFALTAMLEAYKLNVWFAENGKDALSKLHANPEIDLVLMDMMMPEMDGFVAIRAIRGHARFFDLPVIALTAKAMKSDRERCIEAGASDYISKPVQQDQLISLIRVWLYR